MQTIGVKAHNYQKAALAVVVLLFSASVALGQDVCENIEVPLIGDLTREYAKLASEALKDSSPGQISVQIVLVSGAWSVAHIVPANLETGYAFFQEVDGQKILKDVWGGVASSDERDEVASWAETLGAPADLAACFASRAAVDWRLSAS